MAWQTPKTNWGTGDIPVADDFNRIEGNIQELQNTKETPAGAQAKADAAETNAKNHARGLVGSLANLLTTAKSNLVAAINEIFGKVEDVEDDLDSHLADNANPHSVTKSQVGLGNVQNYGMATEAQAKAGTATNVYMNPLRTKQAIDAFTAEDFVTPGNTVLYEDLPETSSSSTSESAVYLVPYTGKYRITLEGRSSSTSIAAIRFFLGAGSAGNNNFHITSAEFSTTGTEYVSFTYDTEVVVPKFTGIVLKNRTGTFYRRNFRLRGTLTKTPPNQGFVKFS